MSEFKTTSVFEKNIIAYNQGVPLIINQGGTRSSKTWSILQLLFLIAINSKERLIISIVSRALPHLKLGAMRDFDHILLSYGIIPDKVKNKTDNYYLIGNSLVEFFGADQKDKVHGPARDILFINEVNFLKEDIYDQLVIRAKGTVFLDYNPTQRFYVHDEVMPNNKHVFIKSTYLDNDHLSEQQIARIESKRKNENWWKVYGLGEVGILEGQILTHWRYGEFNDVIPYMFGLDFGFFPDPDAYLKVAVDHKREKIYCKQLIYETNQGTNDLVNELVKHTSKKELIIAESATPRTIYDIGKRGFNIKPVSKTKTVAEWLRAMQDYEIIITEDSYDLEKELSNYLWSDKKAGIPMDDFNHLIDAMRYVFMETKRGSGKIKRSHHNR